MGAGNDRPSYVAFGSPVDGSTVCRGDDVDDVLNRLRAHGAELVSEVARYGDIHRYCCVRGPAGEDFVVASFPLYDEYARKTDREISIALLTPQDCPRLKGLDGRFLTGCPRVSPAGLR